MYKLSLSWTVMVSALCSFRLSMLCTVMLSVPWREWREPLLDDLLLSRHTAGGERGMAVSKRLLVSQLRNRER